MSAVTGSGTGNGQAAETAEERRARELVAERERSAARAQAFREKMEAVAASVPPVNWRYMTWLALNEQWPGLDWVNKPPKAGMFAERGFAALTETPRFEVGVKNSARLSDVASFYGCHLFSRRALDFCLSWQADSIDVIPADIVLKTGEVLRGTHLYGRLTRRLQAIDPERTGTRITSKPPLPGFPETAWTGYEPGIGSQPVILRENIPDGCHLFIESYAMIQLISVPMRQAMQRAEFTGLNFQWPHGWPLSGDLITAD